MSTSSACLRFVDEHRAGGVHRPERQQPFLHARSAHEGHHRVGQVDQLDALAGVDLDGFGHDGKPPALADVVFATGVSRTVTTELLLIDIHCRTSVRTGTVEPRRTAVVTSGSTDAYPDRKGSWV